MAVLEAASASAAIQHVKAEAAMIATSSNATPAGHRLVSGERAYYRFSDITFEVSHWQETLLNSIPQSRPAHSGTRSSLLIKQTPSNRFSATRL